MNTAMLPKQVITWIPPGRLRREKPINSLASVILTIMDGRNLQ